jgi:hypothetical protein
LPKATDDAGAVLHVVGIGARVDVRPHAAFARETMRQHKTNRLQASATVSGSQRVPSAVREHPLKSVAHTSFGAVAAATGCVSGITYRPRRSG